MVAWISNDPRLSLDKRRRCSSSSDLLGTISEDLGSLLELPSTSWTSGCAPEEALSYHCLIPETRYSLPWLNILCCFWVIHPASRGMTHYCGSLQSVCSRSLSFCTVQRDPPPSIKVRCNFSANQRRDVPFAVSTVSFSVPSFHSSDIPS